VSQATV
jgi:hypothetical protein